MDLSVECWERASPSKREAIAKRLEKQLPSGFYFDAIRHFQLGEHENNVAIFQTQDSTFAFVPSAAVSIGFDCDRPWVPNRDEAESWRDTAEEYGINKTIHEYVAEVTLRKRRVELPAILIELTAKEVGWEAIDFDEPEVQKIFRKHGANVTSSMTSGSIRIRHDPLGNLVAERSVRVTHAELIAALLAQGFRFPTSDEWEYACGAGSQTLFRWGDHVPCDRYPIDSSPGEAVHLAANAFGLSIASNPYLMELVAEVGVTRGGDGGAMICGGAGFWIGWLTLATAYFEEHVCKNDPPGQIEHGSSIGRRVLELR